MSTEEPKVAAEKNKEMSFLEHLEELRWHIIRSMASIMVFAVIAFAMKDFVFGTVIFGPARPDFFTYRMLCKVGMYCIEELPFILQSRQMTGQFTMHITSSVVIGLILAFPYTFWEIWRFISPGLYDNERKISHGAVFWVSILFMMGILFGYYVITPLSINFLANYQVDPSVSNEFDIISYVTVITMLVLACGLLFQLPVVVYFLSTAGLITPELMKTYRRHAIVVILILSALLTPPDPVSQILIALPLLVLYQISIFISRVVTSRNEKESLVKS